MAKKRAFSEENQKGKTIKMGNEIFHSGLQFISCFGIDIIGKFDIMPSMFMQMVNIIHEPFLMCSKYYRRHRDGWYGSFASYPKSRKFIERGGGFKSIY